MLVRNACSNFFLVVFLCSTMLSYGQVNPFDLQYKLNKETPVASIVDTVQIENVSNESSSQIDSTDTSSEDNNNLDTTSQELSRISPSGSENQQRNTEPSSITPTIEPSERLMMPSSSDKPKVLSNLLLFVILLVITVLSTLTISYNKNLITNIIRSVLNDNYLNLIYREQKKMKSIKYLLLYLVFFFNAGLFIYLTLQYFDHTKFNLFYCILFVIGLYAIRHLSFSLLSNVYPFKKEVEQFGFTILIFNIFLGLLLLPINVFIAFGPIISQEIIIYTGLIVIALIYIFRQLRGLFIGSQILTSSTLYFFIYLCAFEILPILALFKLGRVVFA